MTRNDDRAMHLTVRVPQSLADRLDGLASKVNRSRCELIRYLPVKAADGDLPDGWRADAAALRAARAAR